MSSPPPREATLSWLTWLVILLVAASILVAWPFAPWILLASWVSALLRPTYARLAIRLGDRPRLAAIVLVGGFTLLFVPLVVVLTSLAADAYALAEHALRSDRARSVLESLVSTEGASRGSPADLLGLAVRESGRAWTLLQQIAGTAARVVVGLVILLAGLYALLTAGPGWFVWCERHIPLSPLAIRRLGAAFVETGRGLAFGVVGAGLAQSGVAIALYVALGVPQAFALGVLTLVCSIVPAVGTAMVWIPIAIALWMNDRASAAVILAAAGVLVISTIDNLVRPYLARRGKLQLPTFLVLLSMFGGVELMGARGLIVGPLVLRLAKEALALHREVAQRT